MPPEVVQERYTDYLRFNLWPGWSIGEVLNVMFCSLLCIVTLRVPIGWVSQMEKELQNVKNGDINARHFPESGLDI